MTEEDAKENRELDCNIAEKLFGLKLYYGPSVYGNWMPQDDGYDCYASNISYYSTDYRHIQLLINTILNKIGDLRFDLTSQNSVVQIFSPSRGNMMIADVEGDSLQRTLCIAVLEAIEKLEELE